MSSSPGDVVLDDVANKFANLLQAQIEEGDVVELLNHYERITAEGFTELRRLYDDANATQSLPAAHLRKLRQDCEGLRSERATWRLLKMLAKDRLQAQDPQQLPAPVTPQMWEDVVLVSDHEIRRQNIVALWLEKVYAFTASAPVCEPSMGQHTLRNLAMGGSTRLVSEMDPDAAERQKKSWAEPDSANESLLLSGVWQYLRMGQIDKAQELCRRCNQPWRAASLGGVFSYNDPQMIPESQRESGQIEPLGNMYRQAWKQSCKVVAERSTNLHERAVYGLMCDSIKCILPACKDWEDYVWAHFHVMVKMRIDAELQRNSKVRGDPAPDFQSPPMTAAAVLEAMERNKTVSAGAKEPFHVLQSRIILGRTNDALMSLSQWLAEPSASSQLKRFAAHFALLVTLLTDQSPPFDAVHNVVLAYVRHLVDERRVQHVATYVAHLPPDDQLNYYSDFCVGITETEERRQCLDVAQQAGLDVTAISRQVVATILQEPLSMEEDMMAGRPDVSESDKRKISALEWLYFDEFLRLDVLVTANSLLRVFIGRSRLPAAHVVLSQLPADTIDIIKSGWTDVPPLEEQNLIREFESLSAFVGSQVAYSNWSSIHFANPGAAPTKPLSGLLADELRYENALKEYAARIAEWKSQETEAAEEAGRFLSLILMMPGGWLCDLNADGSVVASDAYNDARSREMDGLRKICIPDASFLLHRLLYETKQYQKSLQVADYIASEENGRLYTLFNQDALSRLMLAFRESAVCLLSDHTDPLEYR